MKIIDTSNTQGQIMDIDDLNLVEGDVGTENGNLKMFEYTPEEWNDIQQKIDNGNFFGGFFFLKKKGLKKKREKKNFFLGGGFFSTKKKIVAVRGF